MHLSFSDFAKDCDYTLHMVDNLLDLLTGGDHGKTKKVLDEKKMLREEEEAIKTVLETPKPPVVPADAGVKVDVDDLRSLSSLGINTDFLDEMAEDIRTTEDYRYLQYKILLPQLLKISLLCLQGNAGTSEQYIPTIRQATKDSIPTSFFYVTGESQQHAPAVRRGVGIGRKCH